MSVSTLVKGRAGLGFCAWSPFQCSHPMLHNFFKKRFCLSLFVIAGIWTQGLPYVRASTASQTPLWTAGAFHKAPLAWFLKWVSLANSVLSISSSRVAWMTGMVHHPWLVPDVLMTEVSVLHIHSVWVLLACLSLVSVQTTTPWTTATSWWWCQEVEGHVGLGPQSPT
jgi:hypothetical protein